MPQGIHHLHKRKRIHQNLEPYPHPQPFKNFMDKLIYIVGIMSPLAGSTQAIKVWQYQNAESISLFMFAFGMFSNTCWIIYSWLHKEKPIFIMQILWLLVNTSVVIGALVFR